MVRKSQKEDGETVEDESEEKTEKEKTDEIFTMIKSPKSGYGRKRR